jgi:hypothetical protein
MVITKYKFAPRVIINKRRISVSSSNNLSRTIV